MEADEYNQIQEAISSFKEQIGKSAMITKRGEIIPKVEKIID